MMKQDSQTEVLAGVGQAQDPHRSLHSETGARPGEHPGRSRNPLVKVAGLAWLEFEKPDLDRAERFGTDFGFTVADRTPETLLLRGRQAAAACLVVRRGPQARFVGPTFAAAARDDLDRLARGTGGTVTAHWGGHAVLLRDPSGFPVRVVHGVPELPALPERAPLPLNFGSEPAAGQRHPAAGPAAGGDPAAGPRGAGHHPVPRGPGLVPGHARADRQRLPVPGRAARPRPGDGVHPLRPGQRPGRPPHPGHGPAAAHRLRALGLPAHRPGRGRRQRGVPARARLPARVGPGPAHPGQPDLRLLARPGPG